MTLRERVVTQLLTALQAVRPDEPALIAIDGFDGVGKTYLAQELAALADAATRPILNVSIDGFHRPKAERVAAGLGAEGFYRGSYRYDVFRALVVDAARARQPITPAVWDVDADEAVDVATVDVSSDVIVLVDGIFLQRPELADVWDATVWVDAPLEITVPRGNARFPGTHDPDPEAPVNQRYVGGQRLYLAEADPRSHSTWVFDNTDLERPTLRNRAVEDDRHPHRRQAQQ
nr:uridine kinase [Flexivirga oryzae]